MSDVDGVNRVIGFKDRMRDEPHIGIGMSVEVLDPADYYRPLAEGRVLSLSWSAPYETYLVEVLIGEKTFLLFANNLRKATGPIRDVILNERLLRKK